MVWYGLGFQGVSLGSYHLNYDEEVIIVISTLYIKFLTNYLSLKVKIFRIYVSFGYAYFESLDGN